MSEKVDWCRLPDELLLLIFKRLPILDYVRLGLGAVCSAWGSIVSKKLCPPAPQLPWLMVFDKRCPQPKALNFYCLSQKKHYKFDMPRLSNPGSSPFGKHRVRCCSGWVISFYDNSEIHFMNPFSKSQILLPPPTTLPKLPLPWGESLIEANITGYLEKLVLQPPVDNVVYTVMVIYGVYDNLAYYKSGDEKWTGLQNLGTLYDDIIYYKSKFYGVRRNGIIIACDLSGVVPKVTQIGRLYGKIVGRSYFVESKGDLLLVVSVNFNVFKLDGGKNTWVRVDSLGDRALFLGPTESMSLSAREFTECKENCMYYNTKDLGFKLGIYQLEDGTTEIYYLNNSPLIYPSAFWFMPNL